MNYDRGMLILKEKDVFPYMRFPQYSFLRYGWKKIRPHQYKRETFEHFVSKACLGKLILNLGDGLFTEYEYPNCNVIDVLQIKKRTKELIGYQIETGYFKEKEFYNTDVIVINLKKAPKPVLDAFDILKDYFGRFVVE